MSVLQRSVMQKSEFIERVDSYFQRKRKERWFLSVLSIICLLTAYDFTAYFLAL